MITFVYSFEQVLVFEFFNSSQYFSQFLNVLSENVLIFNNCNQGISVKTEFSVTIFCILDHLTGQYNNVKEINSDNMTC